MRVTKAEVIKTASDMADRNGLHNVSLKAIAENLGIRTPSLYNHIGSLDELLREIAHSGMRTMNEKMIRAAIGKTGDSALKLVAVEYLNYMIEHPGVYEIIQWAFQFSPFFSSTRLNCDTCVVMVWLSRYFTAREAVT